MSEPEPTTPEPTPAAPAAPVAPTTPEPETKWMTDAGLSEDLQANPSITKFKSAEAMGHSYLELQKTLGADKVALPGKDAKPEEMNTFYNRLGRPDKVEGYELSDWEPPKDVPWSMDNTSKMLEKMHARGLSKAQAQGLLADQAELAEAQWYEHGENVVKSRDQTVADLKKKYGAAFEPKRVAGKNAALALIEKLGLSENPFEQKLPDGRLVGDLPGMVEVMMQFGEDVAEDAGSGPGARTTRTPGEAQNELNAMLGDTEKYKILTDVSHPEHKALQERKTDLERQIHA